MSFKALGLSEKLVQGILATGYTAPTEIQSKAIPIALSGKDVIGCAQTGTGKTAAFVLPILNRLFSEAHAGRKHIRAVIITPTRELALQIEASIMGYGRFMKVVPLTVYGGINIDIQLRSLRRGVDIVVATPGRLIDHMNRGSIDLSRVEVLVLDEADRMFDMGFIKDVRKIIGAMPSERQTLMFSATMSREVRSLAAGIQHDPKLVEVGQQRNPAESITQHLYPVHRERKMDLLLTMLQAEEMDSVLVFSRTKHGADKITRRLERVGIAAIAIHSERTQRQRELALQGFKRGKYRVLVATDIAARGIDVEAISHVVNFDVPTFAEDYLHRIGRTGRAAATGDAITFVSRDEENHIKRIEQFIGKKLDRKKYEGFDYTVQPSTSESYSNGTSERPRHAPSRESSNGRSSNGQSSGTGAPAFRGRRSSGSSQGRSNEDRRTKSYDRGR